MPLNHSRIIANLCTICRERFSEHDDNLLTACSHQFHRACLLNWLKRNSNCPQCRAKCHSREFGQNAGAQTRARVAQHSEEKSNNRNPDFATNLQAYQQQTEDAASLPVANAPEVSVDVNDEDNRIRNIVSAVIFARQAANFNNLEDRVSQLIEQKLEDVMSNLMTRLNLNTQPAQPTANRSPERYSKPIT
ncbi:RING-H2 finger protein ATL33-like [Rhagoletis pomonella]|uniref:RING-H2 finger protein ATL33-like n=1 Tax=Rhagoletis pomonella TaxID=28610 RepID=UPI001780CDF2|nr:RING-H2 finger protein ATL33-like [Rhagoletis pomonella]